MSKKTNASNNSKVNTSQIRGFTTLPHLGVKAGSKVVFNANALLGSSSSDNNDTTWVIDGKKYNGDVVSLTWRSAKRTKLELTRNGRTYKKDLFIGIHPRHLAEDASKFDFFYCLILEHRGRLHFIPIAPNAKADVNFDKDFSEGLAQEVDSQHQLLTAFTGFQNSVYACTVIQDPFLNPHRIRQGVYSVFADEAIFLGKPSSLEDSLKNLRAALTYNIEATTYDSANPADVYSALGEVVNAFDPAALDMTNGMRYPTSVIESNSQQMNNWMTGVIGPMHGAIQDLLGDISGGPAGQGGFGIPAMVSYNPHDLHFDTRIGSEQQGFTFQTANAFGDGSTQSFGDFYGQTALDWESLLASNAPRSEAGLTVDAVTGETSYDNSGSGGLNKVSTVEMQSAGGVVGFIVGLFMLACGNDDGDNNANVNKAQEEYDSAKSVDDEAQANYSGLTKAAKGNGAHNIDGQHVIANEVNLEFYKQKAAETRKTLIGAAGKLFDEKFRNGKGNIDYPEGGGTNGGPPPAWFWKLAMSKEKTMAWARSRVTSWIARYPEGDFDFSQYAGQVFDPDKGLEQLTQPASPDDEHGAGPGMVEMEISPVDVPMKIWVPVGFMDMKKKGEIAKIEGILGKLNQIINGNNADSLFAIAGGTSCEKQSEPCAKH